MMSKKNTSRSKNLKKVSQTVDLTISDNEDLVEKENKENVKLAVNKALDDEEKEKLYLKTLNDLRKTHEEKNKNTTVLKRPNQPKIKKTSNTQLIPVPRSEYRAISNRFENIEERPWWDNPADEDEMNEVGSFDGRGRYDGLGSRHDHCSSDDTVEDYENNSEPDNYWKDDYQEIDNDCGWGFSYGEHQTCQEQEKDGHDKENISVENTEVNIPPKIVTHNVTTHHMVEAPPTFFKINSLSRAVKPQKSRKAASSGKNKTRDCGYLEVNSGTTVIQTNAPKEQRKKRLKTTAKHTSQEQTKPLSGKTRLKISNRQARKKKKLVSKEKAKNQPKKERKAVGSNPVGSTEKLPKKKVKRVIERDGLLKSKEQGHEICDIVHNIPQKEVEEGAVHSKKMNRLGIIFEQESRLL